MSAPAVAALIRTSKPQYRNADDRLVYALHAWMLTRGYKLVATGAQALEDAGSNTSTQPEITLGAFDSLPQDDYALLYADVEPQGSKRPVVLRCIKLGSKMIINQLVGGSNTHTLDVDVSAHADAEQHKDLPTLLKHFDTTLAPAQDQGQPGIKDTKKTPTSLQGATDARSNPAAAAETSVPSVPSVPSSRPYEDDPLRDVRQPMPGFGISPLVDPRQGPGLPGGGGMHVGPGDPLFSGGMRGGVPLPGGLPPGGRWDPIAPPGMPGFGPDDFTRGPRRPPHPDVQPPGPGRGADWDNMFG